MKELSYYLLSVWRWIRIPTIIALIIVTLLYSLMWIYENTDCGYSIRTLSPKQGDFNALVQEECCNWGCAVTIKLHKRRGWGFDTEIFVYNPTSIFERKESPWTHDPLVVWLNPNELEIAVDRIGKINSQLLEAHGIKITYRIGFVDSQFAKPLALEGEKVIGLLKTRLADAKDDWAVDDIVYVLKDMVRLETCDVAGDEELMWLVDERVKGMKSSLIKGITEKDVDTIRAGLSSVEKR